jgi:hypothetical protein
MTPTNRGGEDRAAFEKWAIGLDFIVIRDASGVEDYDSKYTESAWMGWQAALSRAEAPSRDALWGKVEEALLDFSQAVYSDGMYSRIERGPRVVEARTALVAAIRKWGER